MREHGNMTQWAGNYPGEGILKDDIKNGISYVCIDEGEIVGTLCCLELPEPTYEKIYRGSWLNEKKYITIHRITSGKAGAGSFMLKHFCAMGTDVRADTHRDNIPMRNLLEKCGFKYCGIIYLDDGAERLAYQYEGGKLC